MSPPTAHQMTLLEMKFAEEVKVQMPKNKIHSGMAKRIRVSGRGKLLRQRAGRRHYLEHKPSTLTRHLDGTVEVSHVDAKRVRRLLGR